MVTTLRRLGLRCLVVGISLSAVPVLADDAEGVVQLGDRSSAGVVRISDQAASDEAARGQSPQVLPASSEDVIYEGEYCPDAYYSDCPEYCNDGVFCNSKFAAWLQGQCMQHRMRNQMASAHLHAAVKEECEAKHAWARCKFGYFVPTGSCGKGSPWVGAYHMAYPVDPSYFDARDGQVYAAAGYGGPVSVPLAPVVNHTYNYGWGVPSSRLTPVLHPATVTPVSLTPSPIQTAPVAR